MKTRSLISLILPCFAAIAVPTATLQASQAEPAAAIEQAKTEADVLYEQLFAELQEAKDKVSSEFGRLADAGEDSGTSTLLGELLDERNAVATKMAEAAKTYAGTEGAIPFLIWRVTERPQGPVESDAVSAALATIQEAHIKSPKLRSMLPILGSLRSRVSAENAASFMAALEASSPVPEVKALASYMRLLTELEGATYGTESYTKLSKDTIAAAKATGQETLLANVEETIKLASKFSLGMLAPDIEGIDLSGRAFKLSDYEGKVVFLDFWGDW